MPSSPRPLSNPGAVAPLPETDTHKQRLMNPVLSLDQVREIQRQRTKADAKRAFEAHRQKEAASKQARAEARAVKAAERALETELEIAEQERIKEKLRQLVAAKHADSSGG